MKKTWTDEKNDWLRKHYATATFSIMETVLNNTEHSIRAQATRLGLKRKSLGEKPQNLTEDNIKSGKYHICWFCKFATNKYIGFCSWSHELKPVKGWTTKQENCERFRILDCPLFEKG